MKVYWHFRGGQTEKPYMIAVTRAEDIRPALEMIYVDQLPSAYDRFKLADGRWDYDAMDENGFDVS